MLIALFAIPLSTAIRFLLFTPRLQLTLPIIAQPFCIAILLRRPFLISWPQVECDSAPTVVNPLSASVQSNGKKRLILDLQHPNYFVMKSKVKFEDAKTMLFTFVDTSQNWLFSFDINSGYHHIDIFPPDQEFLGFSWFKDGFTHFYKFTVLPFGLSTGPYIFIKVMRPLVRYWRRQAFRVAVCLDDGLGVCPSFADCFSQSLAVKSDLFRAGFVANTQKSIWAPVQSLRGLGYRWDLKDNFLTVPEDKIDKLLVSIDNVLSQSSLPARQLASVTGSIISNMLVFGNVCKLMTKSLHRALDRREGWESRVGLDHAARKELEFWKSHVSHLNSRCFADAIRKSSRIVYSDASAVGCAAFIAIDMRLFRTKTGILCRLNRVPRGENSTALVLH